MTMRSPRVVEATPKYWQGVLGLAAASKPPARHPAMSQNSLANAVAVARKRRKRCSFILMTRGMSRACEDGRSLSARTRVQSASSLRRCMSECARVIAHVYKRDFAHALSCTSVTYVHAPVAHGRMGVQGVCLCQCAPGRSEPAVTHLLLMTRTSAVTRDRTFWQPHIRCERLLSVGRPRVRGAAVQAGAQLTGRPEQIQPSLPPRIAFPTFRREPWSSPVTEGRWKKGRQCWTPTAVPGTGGGGLEGAEYSSMGASWRLQLRCAALRLICTRDCFRWRCMAAPQHATHSRGQEAGRPRYQTSRWSCSDLRGLTATPVPPEPSPTPQCLLG